MANPSALLSTEIVSKSREQARAIYYDGVYEIKKEIPKHSALRKMRAHYEASDLTKILDHVFGDVAGRLMAPPERAASL